MVENYGMYLRKICIGVKNKKAKYFYLTSYHFLNL